MKTSTITSILAFSSTDFAVCSRQGSVEMTFFGFPDNDPPIRTTAYNCGGRNNVAGGSGTYDDRLTMASTKGEFSKCEIAYVPNLKKYQCTDDYNNGGKRHIDIWTGSRTVNGGNEQVDCENKLTSGRLAGLCLDSDTEVKAIS
ncbi:hypothetical protein IFR05_005452 [Cadophora sp. M221]|nr:hypothetical protein IFR05_005452 [Cadophora sp. M221]